MLSLVQVNRFLSIVLGGLVLLCATVSRAEETSVELESIQVPEGFLVEQVAASPLVKYPMLGTLDDTGRLFVCESAGLNLDAEQLLEKLPNSVRMLEDTDGDGRFDKSTVFADQMTLPSGAVWHDGALYVSSPPSIWRLEDTDGDGVADRRDEIVTGFHFRGHAGDIHGPDLGPDGRLYFTDGIMGHEIHDKEGQLLSKGRSARIFSSRLDGSDLETFCGGGMANPTAVTISEEGELFSITTFFIYGADRIRHDASFHGVYGGVYPRDRPFVREELKSTGPVLPALTLYGMSAPSNLTIYRSGAFGTQYIGDLFISHFNTRSVTRARLDRDGATFRSSEETFLSSTNPEFHPCDVIEDADGSLLVINTGGWFKIGCPTSSLKPQIVGGIYRVRRKEQQSPADPWGSRIAWKTATSEQLVPYLDDKRFAVRDRTITILASHGESAVVPLIDLLSRKVTVRAKRSALWALLRIGSGSANAAISSALNDPQPSVRLVAATCTARSRDEEALQQLIQMVERDEPPVRRQAAAALGRIGSEKAIPVLLGALAGTSDPILTHAIVYALIEINHFEATLPGLQSPSPRVLRGALVALDQMESGSLTREQVTPLIGVDDPELTHAVLDLVLRNGEWAGLVADLIANWLIQPEISAVQQKLLRKSLLALHTEPSIQHVISQLLARTDTSMETRVLLLEVIAASDMTELPEAWQEQLFASLHDAPHTVVEGALGVMAARDDGQFDNALSAFMQDTNQPVRLRVKAAEVLTRGRTSLSTESFMMLREQCRDDVDTETRLEATRALGNATLSPEQLDEVLEFLPETGPLELPVILNAFSDVWQTDSAREYGLRLIETLNSARGFPSLNETQLTQLFEAAPMDVRAASQSLLSRLVKEQETSIRTVLNTSFNLVGGDVAHGKEIFFSKKALCSSCHQVDDVGKPIGPDLRGIGKVRNYRDLLEAILLPSASFARGFESKMVTTRSGRVYSGVIRGETEKDITLYTSDQKEFRIKRAEIDTMEPSDVSIMPAGLERTLTSDDLRDLLAFLKSLKGSDSSQ